MPKRRSSRDERWERTAGGLIVPRRRPLPARRFIQKHGTAQDCCACKVCDAGDGTLDMEWQAAANTYDLCAGTDCATYFNGVVFSAAYVGNSSDCPFNFYPSSAYCNAWWKFTETGLDLCGYSTVTIWVNLARHPSLGLFYAARLEAGGAYRNYVNNTGYSTSTCTTMRGLVVHSSADTDGCYFSGSGGCDVQGVAA